MEQALARFGSRTDGPAIVDYAAVAVGHEQAPVPAATKLDRVLRAVLAR